MMSWWWTQNEENYNGPADSREEAIERGKNEWVGEAFKIAEGGRMRLKVDVFDDWFWEHFDERNEEAQNPDGDTISAEWKPEDCKELVARLEKTFSDWIEEKGYADSAWALDLGAHEDIPEDLEVQRIAQENWDRLKAESEQGNKNSA